MKSNRRAGLSGASILFAAKRPNWIASTRNEFIKIGKELTANIESLDRERKRLQKNMPNSNLFSPHLLAKEVQEKLSSAIKNDS